MDSASKFKLNIHYCIDIHIILSLRRRPNKIVSRPIIRRLAVQVGYFPSPMGCRSNSLCPILGTPKLDLTVGRQDLATYLERMVL